MAYGQMFLSVLRSGSSALTLLLHQPSIGSQAHLPCCLEIDKSIVQYSAKLARVSLDFLICFFDLTDAID
jgi:hypothetical protein